MTKPISRSFTIPTKRSGYYLVLNVEYKSKAGTGYLYWCNTRLEESSRPYWRKVAINAEVVIAISRYYQAGHYTDIIDLVEGLPVLQVERTRGRRTSRLSTFNPRHRAKIEEAKRLERQKVARLPTAEREEFFKEKNFRARAKQLLEALGIPEDSPYWVTYRNPRSRGHQVDDIRDKDEQFLVANC